MDRSDSSAPRPNTFVLVRIHKSDVRSQLISDERVVKYKPNVVN